MLSTIYDLKWYIKLAYELQCWGDMSERGMKEIRRHLIGW